MNEESHHKGYVVEGMELGGKMMFSTEVSILNISLGGMSVKADRRLEIGRDYVIKLRSHSSVLAVKGQVVWSSLTGSRVGEGGVSMPVYSAGMKFTDLLSERIREVIGFIEGQPPGGEHRVSGPRSNVTGPQSAVLHFPLQYGVKKISEGGMLIECSEALEVDERLPMDLSIPEEVPIHFAGRVASCDLSKAGGVEHFLSRIEFADMGEDARRRLHEFIALLNKISGGL